MNKDIEGGGNQVPTKSEILEHAKISGVHLKKVAIINPDGEQANLSSPFDDYGLYAWEDDATNFYAMYQNKDDKWILIRISDTTGVTTYAKGTSGTSTAWTNRASQSFNDYATTF